MSSVPLAVLFLLLLAVFLWFTRKPGGFRPSRPQSAAEDPEMLEDAEEEVRDLDAFATPEDAEDDLPNWGPGAPRR